jgi:hypothetical protein
MPALLPFEALDSDDEGDPVCQSGLASLVECGEITSLDESKISPYNPDVQIRHLRAASYERDDGDSGAPVFSLRPDGEYEAVGLHQGQDTNGDALYSHIGHVLSDLGLDGVYVSQDHEVLLDGPEVFYRLNEQNSVKSSAGNILPGSYKDVGYNANGAISDDPSAVFRGVQYDSSASIASHTEFGLTDAFTLEAWVKLSSYQTGGGNGVVYKGPSGGAVAHYLNGGNYNLSIQNDGTVRFAFQYQDPGDPNARPSYSLTTPATVDGKVPLNTWTHVVGVYDPSSEECANDMMIFLDGVEQACGPTIGPTSYEPWTNTEPLRIGERADASNTIGDIDEVAIYGFGMSAQRIAEHYDARISGYKLEVLLDAPLAYFELNNAPRLRNVTANSAEGSYIAYDDTTLGQVGFVGAAFGDGDDAAAFSGDARGEVEGTNAYVNQSGDFTVEAWVKPASVSSGARTIVSKGATGSHGGNYWLLTYGNDFSFWYRTKLASCSSSCTFTNNIITWPSAKNAVVGEWYHVVGVLDKCDFPATTCYAKLYVNGTLEGSRSTKDVSGNILAPATNTSPFRIGLAGTTSGVYSIGGGTIDDVAVYSKVLDELSIERHYSQRE